MNDLFCRTSFIGLICTILESLQELCVRHKKINIEINLCTNNSVYIKQLRIEFNVKKKREPNPSFYCLGA